MTQKRSIDRIKALGFSQKEIGDRLGLTFEHVSRIATGKAAGPIYMDAVVELLEALPPKDWPSRWKR